MQSSLKVTPSLDCFIRQDESILEETVVVTSTESGDFVRTNKKNTDFSSPGGAYAFIPSPVGGVMTPNDGVVYLLASPPTSSVSDHNTADKYVYFIDRTEGAMPTLSKFSNLPADPVLENGVDGIMTPIYLRAESNSSGAGGAD